MVDRDALGSWISAEHLGDEAMGEARAAFEAHPARLLTLDGFLAPEAAGQLAAFLADEASYRREYGLVSADGAVEESAWLEAPEDDRFFALSRLDHIPEEHRFSPSALTYLRFRQAVPSPPFVEYFETLTGLSLGPSDDFGVHAMSAGDFLGEHSDENKRRGLAFVLYLSDWEPGFGGSLVMRDAQGGEATVDPAFNRIVMFDVHAGSVHRVARVQDAAGDRVRRTIGGWYDSRV
jgi:hypothetical protein